MAPKFACTRMLLASQTSTLGSIRKLPLGGSTAFRNIRKLPLGGSTTCDSGSFPAPLIPPALFLHFGIIELSVICSKDNHCKTKTNNSAQFLALFLDCFRIQIKAHRDHTLKMILIRSNEIQRYAGVYLLQNYSTCFGCPSHPSSGVHQTVTAVSGTGYSVRATTFRQRGL